jgi:hypothetical protein
MGQPKRLTEQQGRHSVVDGIPFNMPVACKNSPAMFAVFKIDARKARQFIPSSEIHPLRFWGNTGLLVVSVMDYRDTTIGKYVEFSVGIACTHGRKPAPALLPGLFMKWFGTGQYVIELPVSSEVSVKGGKGIWGMPKTQGSLNYIVGDEEVSSQYDLDGQFGIRITIRRPKAWVPMNAGASNYCTFRGMLMKSSLYFKGKLGFFLNKKGAATLLIGDHPRVKPIRDLDIDPDPLLVAFIPSATGVLDDHFECWFNTYATTPAPQLAGEGLESVVNLGLGEQWLPPPTAVPPPGATLPARSATRRAGQTLNEELP